MLQCCALLMSKESSVDNIKILDCGQPRCGTSTLSRKIVALLSAKVPFSGQVLSMELLRFSLDGVAREDDLEALSVRPREYEHSFEEWYRLTRVRDDVAWKGGEILLRKTVDMGENFVYEGLLYPDKVGPITTELGLLTTYLVDTGPAEIHAERIRAIAQSDCTRNNWMSNFNPDRFAKWAEYNVSRGQILKAEAMKYGLPVFDIAHGGIDAAHERALDYIASSLSL